MKKTFAALLSFVGTLTLSTLGVIGCGGDEDSGPVGPSGSVEILNWWYTGGERQALNALLDVYKKKHPEVNVVNSAAIGAVKATEQLNQRMAQATRRTYSRSSTASGCWTGWSSTGTRPTTS